MAASADLDLSTEQGVADFKAAIARLTPGTPEYAEDEARMQRIRAELDRLAPSPPPPESDRITAVAAFAVELTALGFAFDPHDPGRQLILRGTGRRVRVAIETVLRNDIVMVDCEATLQKAKAVAAGQAALQCRLAASEFTGRMADRARFGGVAGRA